MASNPKRIRDYAKEYLIRIARGLAGGESRSQARGCQIALNRVPIFALKVSPFG
jgi:hypothetical protein